MNIIQQQAEAKLAAAIQRTLASTTTAIERIQRDVPQDAIVRAAGLVFAHEGDHLRMGSVDGKQEWNIHRHALGQIAAQAAVPLDYVHKLTGGEAWQQGLLETILGDTFRHSMDRHLVRSIGTDQGPEVRGFLSDKFRRLDTRPLMDTFIEQARAVGAMPYAGVATDIRVSLKALLPTPYIFEIPQGVIRGAHRGAEGFEAVALGAEWRNSDFGVSRNNISIFVLRLWCLNGAVMDDVMKQVHLGGRLDDDIVFSEATYRLDTEASVSAMKDVMQSVFAPEKVATTVEKLKLISQTVVNWDSVKGQFSKLLSKDELRRVDEAYSGPDVVNLPPGDTAWRASNAISWLATATENAERRLELEKLAGSVLKQAA